MIVLGAILLILGFVLKVQILWTIGIILLVIGAVLAAGPLAVPSAAGVTGIDRRVDDRRRVKCGNRHRAQHISVNAPGRPIWPPGLHAV